MVVLTELTDRPRTWSAEVQVAELDLGAGWERPGVAGIATGRTLENSDLSVVSLFAALVSFAAGFVAVLLGAAQRTAVTNRD